jgi:ribosomal protein S30
MIQTPKVRVKRAKKCGDRRRNAKKCGDMIPISRSARQRRFSSAIGMLSTYMRPATRDVDLRRAALNEGIQVL